MVLYKVLEVHPQPPSGLYHPKNNLNLGTRDLLITARLVNLKGYSVNLKVIIRLSDRPASSQLGCLPLVELRVWE